MSISDSDKTAKKAVENTQTDPTSEPGAERDRLTRVDETDATAPALRGAERAAPERAMLSGLERTTSAAERLNEPSPEAEAPSTGRNNEPPSGPKFTTPLPPPFAVTSNGKILLNVDACPDLKLDGRPIFRGIELSEPEAAYAFRRIENTIHDAAGHVGGMLKRRETEGSGGDDKT